MFLIGFWCICTSLNDELPVLVTTMSVSFVNCLAPMDTVCPCLWIQLTHTNSGWKCAQQKVTQFDCCVNWKLKWKSSVSFQRNRNNFWLNIIIISLLISALVLLEYAIRDRRKIQGKKAKNLHGYCSSLYWKTRMKLESEIKLKLKPFFSRKIEPAIHGLNSEFANHIDPHTLQLNHIEK